MISESTEHEIQPTTVMLWLYAVLKAFCGYYIPMSAHILWWSVGVGSLFLGMLYLQFLWTTHFVVDIPIANIAERSWRNLAPGVCPTSGPCYDIVGQDIGTFFFVVLAHIIVTNKIPGAFNVLVCTAAFAIYVASLYITTDRTHPLLATSSLIIGAVVGMSKVFFFVGIVLPLYDAMNNNKKNTIIA